MFNLLTDKLQDSIQFLSGQSKITEENIDSTIQDIRKALLEADVSLSAVKLFISRVEEEARGEKVLRGVKPGEQFIKIINDSLIEILGGDPSEPETSETKEISTDLNINVKQGELNSIMLLGLQGSGKTTSAGKLAARMKEQGFKVLLVPCDLQRPAAIKQLEILAGDAGVDFLQIPETQDLLHVAKLAQEQIKEKEIDLVIYDTAGRLQLDNDLMAQLLLFEKVVKPKEKLLVVDSLIGQEAANVSKAFDMQIGVTGVILSKLDSDTRGGAALSIAEAIKKPIKLASVGEKLDDLENFYPQRIASRILGMGDVLSLVEQAQRKIEEAESKRLEAELMKGNFNYDTFLTAQNMMNKIGDMGSIAKMMGMGSMMKQMGLNSSQQEDLLEQSKTKMARFKSAISSMTKKEKLNPILLYSDASARSRKQRIAKGSGLETGTVDQMVSEFNKMSQMFKSIMPMMQMFQGGGTGDTAPANPLNPAGGMDLGAMQNMMDPMQLIQNMGLNKKQKKMMEQMDPKFSLKKTASKTKKGQKPKVKGFKKP
ncbi:MAG: signal recognition particle protein [Candidatus Caenarcaniphilales bacterium]|nr:signal recognition particle protein [Candidatus Caenarcaniphilales bacterium]